MSAMDLTGVDGSTGSMNLLGPNDDDVTEIAIVYTDIDTPDAHDRFREGNEQGTRCDTSVERQHQHGKPY